MPLPDLQALRHRGRQPHYPKRNRFFLAANANLRLTSLKKALAKLPVHNAILDGEIVCLDKEWGQSVLSTAPWQGRTRFLCVRLVAAERRRLAA